MAGLVVGPINANYKMITALGVIVSGLVVGLILNAAFLTAWCNYPTYGNPTWGTINFLMAGIGSTYWLVMMISLKCSKGLGRSAAPCESDPFEIWEVSTTPREGFSMIIITGTVLSGVARTSGIAYNRDGFTNYSATTNQYSLQVMRIWLRNEVVQSIGFGYYKLGEGSSVRASRVLLNDTNTAYDWTIGRNIGPIFMFVSALLYILAVCAFPTSRPWSQIGSYGLYYPVCAVNALFLKLGFYAVRPIWKRVNFLELEEGYVAPASTAQNATAFTESTSLLSAGPPSAPPPKDDGSRNKFCMHCGFKFPPDSTSNFCGSCGAKQN